jgi:BlaI family penicillinase repressor
MLIAKDMESGMIPTKTEMDVLMVLWKFGPSTVRFVHDKLNEQKDAVIYTSTLKLMQVMKEKGMVDRDESNMKHIYRAVLEEGKVKGSMLDRFIDNLYDGSPSDMIVSLLGNKKTSADELQKIKDLLKNMDN